MTKLSVKLVTWVFLLVTAALVLFPVVMAILGAFKTNMELNVGGSILPKEWQFENFVYAWKEANFARYVKNSVLYSVSATILTVIICAMTAYTFSRRDFPGKKLILGVYSGMMFIHLGALTLRPAFELMVALNLHQSVIGIILMMTGGAGANFFIMYAFMRTIPKDLDEAAMLDGASFFYTFWKVILPLSLPSVGVVALFQFRATWNSYIVPLVFTMSQPHLQPITVGLVNLRYGVSAASRRAYFSRSSGAMRSKSTKSGLSSTSRGSPTWRT